MCTHAGVGFLFVVFCFLVFCFVLFLFLPSANVSTLMALSQHVFWSGRTDYFLFTPARIFMHGHRLHAWAEEAKRIT